MRKIFFLLAVCVFVCVVAHAQDDSPSLGDVARQARSQKQQKDAQPKDATAKDATSPASATDAKNAIPNSKDAAQAKVPHVITNEELPEHTASAARSEKKTDSGETDAPQDASQPTGDRASQAEQWKSQIQQQKSSIADLQRQIDGLSKSIQYAPANCVENCQQWNENQQRKQQQVDSMKSQLEELQHHLEEMQDSARKQGFGSNVYDAEPEAGSN
jgi:predicted RNase H-like nuclease (RuvC/YqgF family)